MKRIFLLLEGGNPIVIKTLTSYGAEVKDYFSWEISLPEHDMTIICFYPSTLTQEMLEKLTDAAKTYMLEG